MKLIKQIVLVALVAVGIFSAIIYTSCTKSACKTVNCLNGGTCNGGACTCDSAGGIGGTNCQIIYRQLYGGVNSSGQPIYYLGNAIFTYTPLDSGYVNRTDDSNTLTFSYGTDSTYTLMQLVWNDGSTTMLTTPINLANNTSTGSTFLIPPTQGGPGDTFMVSGSGSVSTTNASLNLTAVPSHSTTPTIVITIANCGVQ